MTAQTGSAFQSFCEAARERPGSVVLIAAGAGFLCGLVACPLIAPSRASQLCFTSKAKQNPAPAAAKGSEPRQGDWDSNAASGSSTPASTMTCGSSASFLARELDDKLDYTFAFVYRNDLALGKGRLATLCAQAALAQFKKLWRGKSEDLKMWEKGNKSKICLQAEDEAHLLQVESAAIKEGLPTFKVKDSGNRRNLAVMAIGPAKTSRIREATADLRIML